MHGYVHAALAAVCALFVLLPGPEKPKVTKPPVFCRLPRVATRPLRNARINNRPRPKTPPSPCLVTRRSSKRIMIIDNKRDPLLFLNTLAKRRIKAETDDLLWRK
ncbi:hypothetical protein PUN28_015305 [Cardiocondyla obscurior]|uniref:Secreted protein n=1 Tax=Cardiocondyla obscurior TaxID=286306 RepID=A0AAW2ESE8_9HYME